MHAAATAMNVEAQEYAVREGDGLPEAFNAMDKDRREALLVNNEPLLDSHAGVIAGLAAVKRLPAVGYASFADAGGLLAYGANRPALYGRAGYFLDRIFRGAKPGGDPVRARSQIRSDRQLEDRQVTRARDPAVHPAAQRPGDRVAPWPANEFTRRAGRACPRPRQAASPSRPEEFRGAAPARGTRHRKPKDRIAEKGRRVFAARRAGCRFA